MLVSVLCRTSTDEKGLTQFFDTKIDDPKKTKRLTVHEEGLFSGKYVSHTYY